MTFILLIVLTLILLDGLVWWLSWRAVRGLRWRKAWRLAVSVFMAIQLWSLLWVISARLMPPGAESWIPRPVHSMVMLWHFILLPSALLGWGLAGVLLAAVVIWKWTHQRLIRPHSDQALPAPDPAHSRLTRREFLGGVAATAPAIFTVTGTLASLPQLQSFRVRHLPLVVPSLPAELDGLRIAHVSDVHVGRLTSGRILGEIVDRTNALNPDLVLLTGDLINHALADLPSAIEMVRAFRARHGTWLCEGNHDLIESRTEFERRVKNAHIGLLLDESAQVSINGKLVQILGLPWARSVVSPSGALLRGDSAIEYTVQRVARHLEPSAFPILLAHHPHAFDFAARAGIPLTLCGHTHGGQLMLKNGFGFGPWMYRYWSGAYESGNSRAVVSNGVGNWFPLRINAPAEVILVELRAVGVVAERHPPV
jgi:predicted MPP superfamily phosphohydrolase